MLHKRSTVINCVQQARFGSWSQIAYCQNDNDLINCKLWKWRKFLPIAIQTTEVIAFVRNTDSVHSLVIKHKYWKLLRISGFTWKFAENCKYNTKTTWLLATEELQEAKKIWKKLDRSNQKIRQWNGNKTNHDFGNVLGEYHNLLQSIFQKPVN